MFQHADFVLLHVATYATVLRFLEIVCWRLSLIKINRMLNLFWKNIEETTFSWMLTQPGSFQVRRDFLFTTLTSVYVSFCELWLKTLQMKPFDFSTIRIMSNICSLVIVSVVVFFGFYNNIISYYCDFKFRLVIWISLESHVPTYKERILL